jgi:hypothetical protein
VRHAVRKGTVARAGAYAGGFDTSASRSATDFAAFYRRAVGLAFRRIEVNKRLRVCNLT